VKHAVLSKREGRYLDVEVFLVGEVDELVAAAHGAEGRVERTAGGVFEGFPGSEARLLADDSRAADFLHATVCVGDDPMSVQELDRITSLVRDADRVHEEVLVATWFRTIG
jgi:hypothetical protein